jgi:hypothetical protein
MNIYFTLGLCAICIFVGWHGHTWYDGYKGEKTAIVAEQRAAAGEAKIIMDTQKIVKVKDNEKDKCVNQPVPTDLANQLR